MPFALALMASVLVHAAALVGPGWMLPGTHEQDSPPPIEAVLVRSPARSEPAAVAPAVKPLPDKPKAAKPAPLPLPTPVDAPPAVPEPAAAAQSALPGSPGSHVSPGSHASPGSLGPLGPPALPATAAAPAPTLEPAVPVPANTALPGRGRLRYVITRGEGGFVIGQAIHSWEHDGFRYTLQSLTETTGLAAIFKPAQVLQSSTGEITADGLRPQQFRHERAGRVDTANFDWQQSFVAYAGRRESLVGGTQDMLSMYYQVVLLAPSRGVVEMPIATGRKLETYRLEVLGEEALPLPGGARRALHIQTRSGSEMIDLWLGTGADASARGLPLKIRFTDRKGEIFDQIADDLDSQVSK